MLRFYLLRMIAAVSFATQTTEILYSPPKNIIENWIVIKNAFVSGADEIVGHVPKMCHETWQTKET